MQYRYVTGTTDGRGPGGVSPNATIGDARRILTKDFFLAGLVELYEETLCLLRYRVTRRRPPPNCACGASFESETTKTSKLRAAREPNVEVHFFCAQREAGVFLNILSKFRRSSRPGSKPSGRLPRRLHKVSDRYNSSLAAVPPDLRRLLGPLVAVDLALWAAASGNLLGAATPRDPDRTCRDRAGTSTRSTSLKKTPRTR